MLATMRDEAKDREYRYRPAWWLPGGHLQTLWGRFARSRAQPETMREILLAADGDSIELHHLAAADGMPRVLLLHGLEGSLRSHYVRGVLSQARRRGWAATLLVFRGCGETPNTARRFYHSGETSDIETVAAELRRRWPGAPLFGLGVSLGGNVLLKWLGERSATTASMNAAVAISVPFDLEAGARKIGAGVARIYDRSFLASLGEKARRKLARYPDLFDPTRLEEARTVFEFDDAVTAPVHGFRDARDYYRRSSSVGFLDRIERPTLLISARNDPFLPPSVLDRVRDVVAGREAIRLEIHRAGGHVGFVGGPWPWRARYYAEERAFRFFDEVLARARAGYD
jgi:predicted alpha/beta-fold hydrolase